MKKDTKLEQIKKQPEECKGKAVRIHKVGTVTLGTSLVMVGILFLSHMFFPAISYGFIYKIWPVIFILLGVEILLSGSGSKEKEFVYDKTAICLVAVLMAFAMCMAVIGFAIESSVWYTESEQLVHRMFTNIQYDEGSGNSPI